MKTPKEFFEQARIIAKQLDWMAEKGYHADELNRAPTYEDRMNNEPVAWMYNYEHFPDSFVVCRARKSEQDIPLYTHPAKTLTDEEIDELADKFGVGMEQFGGCFRHLDFAREILRKAQEK